MGRDFQSEQGEPQKGPSDGRFARGGVAASAVRKRRRRRRMLLAVLVAPVMIVLCLPYLLSINPVTRLVVSTVNGILPGELYVQDVSLSWFGPCEINGFRLNDAEGREVVNVDRATLGVGLWRVATSPFRFGALNLTSPHVGLYIDEQGEVSLIRAIGAGKQTSPEHEPSSLPALTGRLALSNGSLQVVRADGRELEMSRIDGDFNIDALSDITGKIAFQVAQEGQIAGEVDVRQLCRDGRFRPLEATGAARLSTPTELSLAGLGNFALGQSRTDGKAQVRMEATFGQGQVKVDAVVVLARLQVPQADRADAEPIDVGLSGQLLATQGSLTAHAVLDGQIGDGRLDVTYGLSDPAANLSPDDIVSGVLAGKEVKWPDVEIEGKSRVDVARLGRAVPALLRIQPGVTITGGELEVKRVALRGGDKPFTTGSIVLKNLASLRDGKANAWDPVSLDWDARIEAGSGLRVEKVSFASGFAHMIGRGTPADLHADFQGDLAALQQQASQIFDMGGVELAGGTSGTLDLKRAGQERIDLTLALAAEGFRQGAGEHHLEVGKLHVKKTGYFSLAGSRVTRLTITDATWDADGRVGGTGSGWAGIGDDTFHVEMNVPRADLGYIASRLVGLGVAGAAGYAGEAALEAKVHRASKDSPVLSEGAVVVRNTRLRDEPLLAEEASLTWSGLSVSPGGRQFGIQSAELTSTPARLLATGVNIGVDKQLAVAGKVEGVAELARCLELSSRIAGREKPPAIAGRLRLSAVSQGTADGASLIGDARIDSFAVGAGDKAIRESDVRLAVQAGIHHRQETITVDRFQMDSQILAVKMTGKISDYMRTCLLDLQGDYRASWDGVTALIHELAPTTADTLVVAGASESRFTVRGAANDSRKNPVYVDASAGMNVGWASASVYGAEMGPALLAPSFKQGQLIVPVSTIPASGGRVHLGGEVDFRSGTPTLSLGRQLQILENVRITPALGRELLSRVNPIFGSLASAEGAVSLMTENIRLPLGEKMKTGGSGQGRLDLQNLKVQPSGLLSALIELGGMSGGDRYAVQVGGVDFRLQDGRLYYEQFTLAFGQDFDLRFHGSVGFDDTLDLAVSVPVRPALLTRLGVGGPTSEYARRLAKTRVEIPIVGTRLKPKMDLSQVDLRPLIEEAARSVMSQGADGLLNSLMGIQQTAKPDGTPVGIGRPPVPAPQGVDSPAVGRGKALIKQPAGLSEAVKPSAIAPSGRPAVVKPGAGRVVEAIKPPAAKQLSQPAIAKPTASRPVQTAPASVEPAPREPIKLPIVKPAARSEAAKPVTSVPAPRKVVLPRPTVRERAKPVQTRAGSQPE